jgi:hypothetical protein
MPLFFMTVAADGDVRNFARLESDLHFYSGNHFAH